MKKKQAERSWMTVVRAQRGPIDRGRLCGGAWVRRVNTGARHESMIRPAREPDPRMEPGSSACEMILRLSGARPPARTGAA